jgi:hypothetical protein
VQSNGESAVAAGFPGRRSIVSMFGERLGEQIADTQHRRVGLEVLSIET